MQSSEHHAFREKLFRLLITPAVDLEYQAWLIMRSHQRGYTFLTGGVGDRVLMGATVPVSVENVIEDQLEQSGASSSRASQIF
jgi:hypothetical protein